MRAFIMAVIAIIVIAVGANFALTALDMSSERVYQTSSVRTGG